MKGHTNFPSWRYHPVHPAIIVHRAEEDEQLSDAWRRTPYSDEEKAAMKADPDDTQPADLSAHDRTPAPDPQEAVATAREARTAKRKSAVAKVSRG